MQRNKTRRKLNGTVTATKTHSRSQFSPNLILDPLLPIFSFRRISWVDPGLLVALHLTFWTVNLSLMNCLFRVLYIILLHDIYLFSLDLIFHNISLDCQKSNSFYIIRYPSNTLYQAIDHTPNGYYHTQLIDMGNFHTHYLRFRWYSTSNFFHHAQPVGSAQQISNTRDVLLALHPLESSVVSYCVSPNATELWKSSRTETCPGSRSKSEATCPDYLIFWDATTSK